MGGSGRPPSPPTFGAPRRSRGAPLYGDSIVRARWWLRRGRDDAHVAVALAPLEANDAIDLGEERVIGHTPDVHPVVARDQHDRAERDGRPGLSRQPLHGDDLAGRDAVLLTAGCDDRFHDLSPFLEPRYP